MPGKAAVGVAARRRQRQKAFEVGEEQIEDLSGVNLEHALLKEVAERIGVLVSRHLQDALVDGQHRDSRRLTRCEPHGQRGARLHQAGRDQRDGLRARGQVRGERGDAVRQRAHEELV